MAQRIVRGYGENLQVNLGFKSQILFLNRTFSHVRILNSGS